MNYGFPVANCRVNMLFVSFHFNLQISNSWSYPPLTDAADVAKKVHEALAERGWMLR